MITTSPPTQGNGKGSITHFFTCPKAKRKEKGYGYKEKAKELKNVNDFTLMISR